MENVPYSSSELSSSNSSLTNSSSLYPHNTSHLVAVYKSYNYTRSDTELLLLIIWTSWSLVVAMIGNTIILVGVYSRAFRIDKLSLLTIKNLAVSDIYFNLIWVLPTLVTLLHGNTWVLGPVLCSLTTYLQYPPAIATIFFITLISVNKWVRCQFPLKTLDLTTKTAYKITIGIWGFSFLHPLSYVVSNFARPEDPRYFELDPFKGSCNYHHGANLSVYWNGLDLTCALVCCMTPSMVLLVSNVAILYIVKKKGRGNVKVSNLLMIVCLTYLFFVSYMPYTVKYLMPFLVSDPDILPDAFVVMTYFLLYANSWANIFIYYFTNVSFKKFVLKIFKCSDISKTTTSSLNVMEKSRLAHIDRVRKTQLTVANGQRALERLESPRPSPVRTIIITPEEICPDPLSQENRSRGMMELRVQNGSDCDDAYSTASEY